MSSGKIVVKGREFAEAAWKGDWAGGDQQMLDKLSRTGRSFLNARQ